MIDESHVASRGRERSLAELPRLQLNSKGLLTEDSVAEAFAKAFSPILRRSLDQQRWLIWDGSVWRRQHEGYVFDLIRRSVRVMLKAANPETRQRAAKASFITAIEKFCRADPTFSMDAAAWDCDPMAAGTPSGTLDLRTGRLRPADPEAYITRRLAVAPADHTDCPRWKQFLDEASGGDSNMVAFIKRWAGYLLTGSTEEHALLFVWGPGGNGKSVMTDTIAAILGEYAVTAPMDVFTATGFDRHPTELAMLDGARLVTASETERGSFWKEARVKGVTAGDKITARYIRQDFFSYKPQFKLMVIGNHMPVLQATDDAIRRRFNLLAFEHQPRVVDRKLQEKLREEWPAILRWMIDGCLEWQKRGLDRPAAVELQNKKYFQSQDEMGRWLKSECETHPGNPSFNSNFQKLYASWKDYALSGGRLPGSIGAFAEELESRGFRRERTRRKRSVIGIKLLSEEH